MKNRLIRFLASILGIFGRATGLTNVPFLQNLYFRLAGPAMPTEDLWVTMDGQQILIPNPRDNVLGRRIYLHGIWEEDVTRVLCEEIRPGMTTLDVGAHIGYYTLLMAKRVGNQGHVFSFEPNPVVRNYLEQNIKRNQYSQVTICPVALFSKAGYGALEGRDNLNSVLSNHPSSTDSKVSIAVFDQIKNDLGIQKVNLIKMDVEGAELDILLGMRKMLTDDHPALIIEIHQVGLIHFDHTESEFRRFVMSVGYTITTIWSHINTTTVLCR